MKWKQKVHITVNPMLIQSLVLINFKINPYNDSYKVQPRNKHYTLKLRTSSDKTIGILNFL